MKLNGLGTLDGTFGISRDGLKFAQFRGVPYATPPVGDLRSTFVTTPLSKKNIDCWSDNFVVDFFAWIKREKDIVGF